MSSSYAAELLVGTPAPGQIRCIDDLLFVRSLRNYTVSIEKVGAYMPTCSTHRHSKKRIRDYNDNSCRGLLLCLRALIVYKWEKNIDQKLQFVNFQCPIVYRVMLNYAGEQCART